MHDSIRTAAVVARERSGHALACSTRVTLQFMPKMLRLLAVVVLLSTALVMALSCSSPREPEAPMTASTVTRSKDIGDEIVTALKAFRKETAVFPDTLADLVPNYMERIPAPVAGVPRWFYRVDGYTGEFALEFGSMWQRGKYPDPSYAIDSITFRWVSHD